VDVWTRRMSPVRRVPSDLAAIFRIAGARVLVMYLVQVAKHLPEILRSRTLRAADEGMSGKVYTFRVLGKQVRLEGSELWSRPRDLRAYRVLSSPQGAT